MHDLRRWTGPVLLLSLAALGACTRGAKEGGGADSGAAAADSTGAPARALVGEPAPPEMPQSYRTISDSGFDAYLAGLRWLGPIVRTGARVCRGNAHSERCRLDIQGVRGVKAVDPRRLGRNGVIVARIRNLGTEDERGLGVPAGATRYWVMLRDSTGRPSAVILDPAHRDAGWLLRVASCDSTRDPGHVHEAASRAAFRCCGACPPAPPPGPPAAVQPVSLRQADPTITAPPWVTCALGCCYVEDDPT